MAQIFVGRKTLVIDVYGMGSAAEFVNTLEDIIRKRGPMDKLISDSAKVEISRRVKEILRALMIDDWQSERNRQNQNFAEHRWCMAKRNTQWIMNLRNVHPSLWLLCLQWVADVMNMTAEKSLGWRTPLEVLTGQTTDISIMLVFVFNDVVYVPRYKEKNYQNQVGSEKSSEIRCRFVGFAHDVGHALTFKLLTEDTKQIIHRSQVRLAKDGENNLKLDIQAGAVPERIYLKSKNESSRLPTIDISVDPFQIGYDDDDDDDEGSRMQNETPQGPDTRVITGPNSKATTSDTADTTGETPTGNLKDMYGCRVAKRFGKKVYQGTVTGYDKSEGYWFITYDDGDEEEMNDHELRQARGLMDTLTRNKSHAAMHTSTTADASIPGESAEATKPTSGEPTEVNTPISGEPKEETGSLPTKKGEQSTMANSTRVKSNGSDNRTSPLDQPPLRDTPVVETIDEDEDLAPHLRKKGGTEVPKEQPDVTPEMVDFVLESLRTVNPTASRLTPEEMIGRTFLMPPKDDGTRHRAKIIDKVNLSEAEEKRDPDTIKFRCLVNDEHYVAVDFKDIVDYIELDETWDGTWKFEEILDHKKVKRTDKENYRGSSWNVLIRWTTGERTWEPLHRPSYERGHRGIWEADPVTVAIYADKHGLLNTAGWMLPGMRQLAHKQKTLIRQANQAKLHSFRHKPIYMYGFQVPRNHAQAMELDRENGNTRWRDAEIKELGQIDEYNTFKDMGPNWKAPNDYKRINVHIVYAVKHDGRHKARLVAGGHLTDTPIDSVYSSVVSLRGIRLLTFIAELNECETWATDIGNAYLESYTKEKVYIKAGPEFGDRAGHYLIIVKALYGLKSSGLRWHERLADVLRAMGFFPSKAEPDIWMRDKGTHYEYIGVYVDDLLIVSKTPRELVDILEKTHKFKLKGTGPIEFHLGCDFFRDEEGNLCYAPKRYIEKILANFERIFGHKPKQATSPLTKGDHPELDESELLDLEMHQIYQSLVGALQWVIQIGRFDIMTAVMTMSRFRAAPREGHMDRLKRIHGYLSKMRYAIIRIRTEEPDFSNLPEKHYDWENTVYKGATEVIPDDIPTPRGKRVQTAHYKDANLFHCMITGRSVSGILHFANKTPIDWFSKLQGTVESATFGSEFSCGRTCVDQVVDLRTTFRYLGVPIETPAYMFGDNESVVNSASVPQAKLHKRHTAISFHRVREAIASGMVRFWHIAGAANPADILSKHWDYASVWPQLKTLLFWQGNTAPLADKVAPKKKKE